LKLAAGDRLAMVRRFAPARSTPAGTARRASPAPVGQRGRADVEHRVVEGDAERQAALVLGVHADEQEGRCAGRGGRQLVRVRTKIESGRI
jgi:hypothetical protein